VCYTTVYRGIYSLTLTYTTRDSCITYNYNTDPLPFIFVFIYQPLLTVFSARCNIYILHLYYDVSVRLSVTFVHCVHRVQWIPDTFARLDRWMSLLLTDNASPGSSDGMMPEFLVEEGRGHLALSWPLLGPLVTLTEVCF